jgi:hypothetical protein
LVAAGRGEPAMTATRLLAALVVAGAILGAARGAAGATLITHSPIVDRETGELTIFIGGISDSGRSLKISSVEAVINGTRSSAPIPTEVFSDYALAASAASQTWKPPVAIGVVYLWVEGVPSGILDGIHGYFRRVPPRTTVFPTIYGRKRQARAQLTASNISRLDEVPYLDGYRPNLAAAIRTNLADLVADKSALKVMLVITDGRDFSDPKGEEPEDFDAVGAELRKAGINLQVVSFPPEDAADAAQSATNLRDLQGAAGAFARSLERAEDLENTVESLGQAIGDLQRVRLTFPWSTRAVGGSQRVALRVAADGKWLTADLGKVVLPGGKLSAWAAGVVGGLLVAVGAIFLILWVQRRRSDSGVGRHREDDGDDDDNDEDSLAVILAAAHDLVRRGLRPERAIMELTRKFPEKVGRLAQVDDRMLSSSRLPSFRTRAGRLRFQEMQAILTRKTGGQSALGPDIAEVLAALIASQASPQAAAKTFAARLADDQCSAFLRLRAEEIAAALRAEGRRHPSLATPRARGFALALQDELRDSVSTSSLAIAWLVRASGPGPRGQTVRLDAERLVVGRGATCQIRIDGDAELAERHAEIAEQGGEFTIAPLEGQVKVEAEPVSQPRSLADGETIRIGGSEYVFKCASIGSA